MTKTTISVLLVGVGGQGILMASDIVAVAAMNSGYDVKKSEVHGMAQRGGSVLSQVRFGEKVYSPLIGNGQADYILSFEKLETLRYLDLLKDQGIIIVNDQKIVPLTVHFEGIEYPQNIEELCRRKTESVILVPAIKIAKELGNPRVLNTILLGVLACFLDFKDSVWTEAIAEKVPTKTRKLNICAFNRGRQWLLERRCDDRESRSTIGKGQGDM